MDILDFTLIDYYTEFRSAIFISSVTLGTFLFTMKTFIIQTMKSEIYDSVEYQKGIRDLRSEGMSTGYYTQLRNFSAVLFYSIFLAFLNAFLQITLGYINHSLAVYVCIAFSFFSWGLVLIALYLVSENLKKMLDISERRAQDGEV